MHDGHSMVFCITFLRFLAACLITNAHYTGIYPTDLIANGGLLGDVLFFAVSGYCLANVKYELSIKGFCKWFGKRIWRIYPSVLVATAIFMLLGYYSLGEHNAFWWFCYPTGYHFVASIIVLYIPYFWIMRMDATRKNIPWIMLAVGIVYLGIYCLFYDKSHYHIDTVREPMIRFLFGESLLLGAWFRIHDAGIRNHFKWWLLPVGIGLFGVYFLAKVMFSRNALPSQLQFLNQVILFALLFCIFHLAVGGDHGLERLPGIVRKCISFISSITLEIYVVQYVLIGVVRDWRLPFPLNWIAVTSVILLSAFVLHQVCHWLQLVIDQTIEKSVSAS